jgi:hypothetical protein
VPSLPKQGALTPKSFRAYCRTPGRPIRLEWIQVEIGCKKADGGALLCWMRSEIGRTLCVVLTPRMIGFAGISPVSADAGWLRPGRHRKLAVTVVAGDVPMVKRSGGQDS